MKVPDGYTGIVSKDVISTNDEDKKLKAYAQFKEFTYWNLDKEPSIADRYQQAMKWIHISKAVSFYVI